MILYLLVFDLIETTRLGPRGCSSWCYGGRMTAGVTDLTNENMPGTAVRYAPPSPDAVMAAIERLYRAIYCLDVTVRQVEAERSRLRAGSHYGTSSVFERWAWLNDMALAATDELSTAAAEARPFLIHMLVDYEEGQAKP
jgi:hypothetical protein